MSSRSLLAFLVFFFTTSHCRSTHAEFRKIGLIAPLTGPASEHGQAMLEGLRLGLEDGRCKDQLELVTEDDGFDPKRSAAAAQKLVNQNQVEVLMCAGSGPSHAVAPITEKKQIPLFTLAADPRITTNRPHVMRMRGPAEDEGKGLARLAERENVRSLVLLCSMNDFTLAVCNSVEQELGSKVVLRRDFNPEDADFRSTLSLMRTLDFTHVAPIMLPVKLGLFAKQFKQLSFHQPIIGGAFFESSSDLRLSDGALLGARYVASPVAPDFLRRFSENPAMHTGSAAWAAIFFDLGMMLCKARETKRELFDELSAMSPIHGVVGTIVMRKTATDRYFDYPFVEKVVSKDGFLPIVR